MAEIGELVSQMADYRLSMVDDFAIGINGSGSLRGCSNVTLSSQLSLAMGRSGEVAYIASGRAKHVSRDHDA